MPRFASLAFLAHSRLEHARARTHTLTQTHLHTDTHTDTQMQTETRTLRHALTDARTHARTHAHGLFTLVKRLIKSVLCPYEKELCPLESVAFWFLSPD